MTGEWRDVMKVGIDQIDDDHRGLFATLNELDLAIRAATPVEHRQLAAILDRLSRYARDHFAREEAIQEEAGYEGLEENRRQHVELTRTLEAFIDRFTADRESDPGVTAETMRTFLTVWITEHVVKVDRKMRGRILPWSG